MLSVKSFKNEKQAFYFDNRGNRHSPHNTAFLWCSIERNPRKINGHNSMTYVNVKTISPPDRYAYEKYG